MKKILTLLILLILLILSITLIGCNNTQPDTILGKWNIYYPSINEYGELYCTINFNSNNTYCSYINGSKTAFGEYKYSYSTKELKEFNRNECGYMFKDTVTYKAYVQNNILYIEAFNVINEYTR